MKLQRDSRKESNTEYNIINHQNRGLRTIIWNNQYSSEKLTLSLLLSSTSTLSYCPYRSHMRRNFHIVIYCHQHHQHWHIVVYYCHHHIVISSHPHCPTVNNIVVLSLSCCDWRINILLLSLWSSYEHWNCRQIVIACFMDQNRWKSQEIIEKKRMNLIRKAYDNCRPWKKKTQSTSSGIDWIIKCEEKWKMKFWSVNN